MSTTATPPRPAKKSTAKRGANLAGPKKQDSPAGIAARSAELERARGLRGAAEIDPTNAEQAERARMYVEEGSHAGLAGKALTRWIATGEGLAEQTNGEEAQLQKAAAAAAAKKARAEKKGASSSSSSKAGKGGGLSAKDAAAKVLRDGEGPQHWKAIAEAIIKGRLAPGLQGSTPEQTISAMLTVDSKKSDGRFVKTAPGTFDLRELNPRAKANRPAAKKSS